MSLRDQLTIKLVSEKSVGEEEEEEETNGDIINNIKVLSGDTLKFSLELVAKYVQLLFLSSYNMLECLVV